VSKRLGDTATLRERLRREAGYVADDLIADVLFLTDGLDKPLLVEGPAGVGKTELAKAAAALTGSRLLRLQCYEGLDEAKALYEWNYKKQLLRIQADDGYSWEETEANIFTEDFLLERPLLAAIRSRDPVVLLIDEVDRVEVETEALLLEVLSDFQVSIPELGTVTARQAPLVILTSNATRELSEALKRRCLYLHLDYPDAERERQIIELRVPDIQPALAAQYLGDRRLGPQPRPARRDRARLPGHHPYPPRADQEPARPGAGDHRTRPDQRGTLGHPVRCGAAYAPRRTAAGVMPD